MTDDPHGHLWVERSPGVWTCSRCAVVNQVTEYLVTWSMPITARTAADAAQQALGIHRDPQSIATVFVVDFDDRDSGEGRTVVVDLHSDGTVNDVREP